MLCAPCSFRILAAAVKRAGGLGDVVHQQDVAAVDLADDVDRLDPGGALALLGHEAEGGAEDVGVGGGHLHAADIGREDDQVVAALGREILEEDRRGEEVVHRDVEEALDLLAVQIHRQDAVGAGGDEQVGHELGGDGHAGLVLAVLARVAVERDHGGDALRRGALAASIMMSSSIR